MRRSFLKLPRPVILENTATRLIGITATGNRGTLPTWCLSGSRPKARNSRRLAVMATLLLPSADLSSGHGPAAAWRLVMRIAVADRKSAPRPSRQASSPENGLSNLRREFPWAAVERRHRSGSCRPFCHWGAIPRLQRGTIPMDNPTKHEIWILTVVDLSPIPLLTAIAVIAALCEAGQRLAGRPDGRFRARASGDFRRDFPAKIKAGGVRLIRRESINQRAGPIGLGARQSIQASEGHATLIPWSPAVAVRAHGRCNCGRRCDHDGSRRDIYPIGQATAVKITKNQGHKSLSPAGLQVPSLGSEPGQSANGLRRTVKKKRRHHKPKTRQFLTFSFPPWQVPFVVSAPSSLIY